MYVCVISNIDILRWYLWFLDHKIYSLVHLESSQDLDFESSPLPFDLSLFLIPYYNHRLIIEAQFGIDYLQTGNSKYFLKWYYILISFMRISLTLSTIPESSSDCKLIILNLEKENRIGRKGKHRYTWFNRTYNKVMRW